MGKLRTEGLRRNNGEITKSAFHGQSYSFPPQGSRRDLSLADCGEGWRGFARRRPAPLPAKFTSRQRGSPRAAPSGPP